MPIYKNQPSVPGDTPVRRYLTLGAVIATVNTRQLRLTRVDTFHVQDSFEGSVPKQTLDDQNLLLIGAESRRTMMNSVAAWNPGMGTISPPDEDSWLRITRWRRNRTRSAHASCWSMGPESDAMWRLYCNENKSQGLGVALRTTLERLKESVATHDLYVSPIIYRPYHEGAAFTDEMDPLLHKRQGYEAERELRLLRVDEAHYRALLPKDASVPELPVYFPVDWVLSKVIAEIEISPYADVNYENSVRQAIHAADASLRVRLKT
jgi:hypothetical protein